MKERETMTKTTIPANAKKLDHRVLAEGEVTGHAHRATAGTLYQVGDSLILESPQKEPILHEEHDLVVPPAVECDVVRVQEYDHAAEEAKQVVD